MSMLSNFSAKLWSLFAADNITGPQQKGNDNMVTVAKIKPRETLEHATIHWLNSCIELGKSEVFTQRIALNPGVAANLLDRNPDNRNVSATKAEHYAVDMAAGRWADNGETIIISSCGLVNDGQHRLQAIIDSNTVIPATVVFGVPRETRLTVDQGKARSAGDYLGMEGHKYAAGASTATKWIIAYERSGGKSISQRSKVTNAEVVIRVKADAGILDSAAFAMHHYPTTRSLLSPTVMTVAHYLLSDIHPGEAKAFLDTVALGENIKRGDPEFAVRQAFLAEKRDRQDALEIIFHGWNAYRQGRPLKLAKCYGSLPALV